MGKIEGYAKDRDALKAASDEFLAANKEVTHKKLVDVMAGKHYWSTLDPYGFALKYLKARRANKELDGIGIRFWKVGTQPHARDRGQMAIAIPPPSKYRKVVPEELHDFLKAKILPITTYPTPAAFVTRENRPFHDPHGVEWIRQVEIPRNSINDREHLLFLAREWCKGLDIEFGGDWFTQCFDNSLAIFNILGEIRTYSLPNSTPRADGNDIDRVVILHPKHTSLAYFGWKELYPVVHYDPKFDPINRKGQVQVAHPPDSSVIQ